MRQTSSHKFSWGRRVVASDAVGRGPRLLKRRLHQKLVAATSGPVIWEVKLKLDYSFEPKLSSEKLPDGRMVSKPLEDMFPFLPREEFARNMLS